MIFHKFIIKKKYKLLFKDFIVLLHYNNMKSYNEELIQIMNDLYHVMMLKGEIFRAKAYKKCQEIIMLYNEPIHSAEQLKGLKGIGKTMLCKINEYITTGKLELLEREKNSPIYQLTNVYGIGNKKARELVKEYNIHSIQELRENQHLLNNTQKIGLAYYEDILERIPRDEIDLFYRVFDTVLNNINSKQTASFQIVGSYRRGAETSGDIDVILTDKTNNKEIFKQWLDELKKRNIITHFLSRGNVKSLVIGSLNNISNISNIKVSKTNMVLPYRRIDFLYTTPEEYPFSLLYFTGSARFNTLMRERARKLGYTMNEHGLYHIKNKKKAERVNHSFHTEKDIFNFLGLDYKEPNERL